MHCNFCNKFPKDYQNILEGLTDDEKPEHWHFVLNANPHTNFHALIVFKRNKNTKCIKHIDKLPPKALDELGKLMKVSIGALKKVDPNIKNIFVLSFNQGNNTKHVHFHLLPLFDNEYCHKINDPCSEGGAMFFSGRKEIAGDTFSEYMKQVFGINWKRDYNEKEIKKLKEDTNVSKELIVKMNELLTEKIKKNKNKVRKIFKILWVNYNKSI